MTEPITEYIEEPRGWGEPARPDDEPKPGMMQVYYRDGVPLMVDFLCPCGCGRTCPTHLVEPGHVKKPNDGHWNFSKDAGGRITLTPSIRWTAGCFAHFNITDGKAVMHADSGIRPS